eukprot:1310289-Amphidinium_carterae.1
MQPTAAEAVSIQNLADLFTWARVPEAFRAPWLTLTGFQDTDSIALLASLDAGYYEMILSGWFQPDGSPFPPATYAQAALLGHAARAMLRPTLLPVVASPTQQPSSSSTEVVHLRAVVDDLKRRLDQTDSNPAKKFKLSGVVDQSLDEEISVMAKKDVHAAFQEYEKVMGGPPPVDAECTDEQLSSIKHLLDLSLPPYADFAVFGPHGYRIR